LEGNVEGFKELTKHPTSSFVGFWNPIAQPNPSTNSVWLTRRLGIPVVLGPGGETVSLSWGAGVVGNSELELELELDELEDDSESSAPGNSKLSEISGISTSLGSKLNNVL